MIRVEKISFTIGDFRLYDFSLEVSPGRYFVLLGPPGSGKTIFLECLCGLKRIGSGSIHIDGSDVTRAHPSSRHIGYVPQDYALFPHLSVEANIAFGLRSAKISKTETARKVGQTAELLGVSRLLPRGIAGLSGGEKQRTALARALVTEPKILLLDEPVCALDEATRQKVCTDLLTVQKELALTTIHVSHNLEEAFSMADSAGVLSDGRLEQVGTMAQLLRQPKNEFVARFMRCENIFDARVLSSADGTVALQCNGVRLRARGDHAGAVKLMIRPENIVLTSQTADADPAVNQLAVKIIAWRDCGNYARVELKGPIDLIAHIPHRVFADINAAGDKPLAVKLDTDNIWIFKE